jgi:hypothetical protein
MFAWRAGNCGTSTPSWKVFENLAAQYTQAAAMQHPSVRGPHSLPFQRRFVRDGMCDDCCCCSQCRVRLRRLQPPTRAHGPTPEPPFPYQRHVTAMESGCSSFQKLLIWYAGTSQLRHARVHPLRVAEAAPQPGLTWAAAPSVHFPSSQCPGRNWHLPVLVTSQRRDASDAMSASC